MTWLDLGEDSPYGTANLPYGVFSRGDGSPRVGVRIGERVLDLTAVLDDSVFAEPSLNAFLAQGRARWSAVRARITALLTEEEHRARVEPALFPVSEVTVHLPVLIGDYVDFFANEFHAGNVGMMLRPGADPLPPNWKHLPLGYVGRAGTVMISGTPVARPHGQRRVTGAAAPEFGPCVHLDFEAEVGFVIGSGSRPGRPVGVGEFADHVFGVCLVNDWSARDLQAWDATPLGPSLSKAFATSVSPWVVPLDALEHARVEPPARDPEPLPYLADTEKWGLDITLEVRLNGHVVSNPPFATMYWTPAQMLAQLTANGAAVRTGDLYASGTVSGPLPAQRGCLLELSWGGHEPISLPGGAPRAFLEDRDEVVITATAPGAAGTRVGFGEVSGRILPAR
ncbi:fumarylacetoacetase [Amycolatopsis taiwanensis]|uniref:fumarylacetoacetase n=1 Tax=Amycolatopsis taiwanensis TaxID=342230 RepID=UPI00048909A2|nr:fumarylacetoacetase [Amycolatopsis taiwanensis]